MSAVAGGPLTAPRTSIYYTRKLNSVGPKYRRTRTDVVVFLSENNAFFTINSITVLTEKDTLIKRSLSVTDLILIPIFSNVIVFFTTTVLNNVLSL